MKELLLEKYKYILEDGLLKEIILIGQFKEIQKHQWMIDIGDELKFMPLILEGAIKVMNEDENGNEYLMYYLETGDSCAMTMTCCIGGKKSSIRAITEQDTKLIMIPISKMEEWLIRYKTWRAFVLDSYDTRLKEMQEAISVLAFHNMEERLYKYLRDKAMILQTDILEITHSEIALDMNTSRVVISRLLKKLSLDNKITMNRNQIGIKAFMSKS